MNFAKKIFSRFSLLACCTPLLINQRFQMSEEPILSQILRGEYENKIRRYSPPEKIFDVFATIYEKGQLYMTVHDLLRAICFYNFSVSDDKDTVGFTPETILKLLGRKEKFEIYDYFILARFIAFERKKIEKYFEENVKVTMGKEEFKTYLRDVVCADYSEFIKPPIGLESRQFRPNEKRFHESIDETVNSMFTHRPEGFTINDIVEFRRNMIREIYSFEFLMFRLQEGRIDGTDFARSIIKYVEASKKRKYMKRVKQINPEIEKIKISEDSYVGFHFYMNTNMEELLGELKNRGALDSETLYDLINKYVTSKRRVSKDQIDILVKVLDIDDSGFIEKREFIGVLESLQYYTKVKSGEHNFSEMMLSDYAQLKDKALRIYEILKE